mmetsp:Transcript_27398/g.82839  ORF Transcript_27398/g.82839 Transcript_27398/m.82839 type:complete len:249 (+) Transcript_27398:1435-2181(+)
MPSNRGLAVAQDEAPPVRRIFRRRHLTQVAESLYGKEVGAAARPARLPAIRGAQATPQRQARHLPRAFRDAAGALPAAGRGAAGRAAAAEARAGPERPGGDETRAASTSSTSPSPTPCASRSCRPLSSRARSARRSSKPRAGSCSTSPSPRAALTSSLPCQTPPRRRTFEQHLGFTSASRTEPSQTPPGSASRAACSPSAASSPRSAWRRPWAAAAAAASGRRSGSRRLCRRVPHSGRRCRQRGGWRS